MSKAKKAITHRQKPPCNINEEQIIIYRFKNIVLLALYNSHRLDFVKQKWNFLNQIIQFELIQMNDHENVCENR